MRRLLVAACCLLPLPALAATLFGVVTERAAPMAAEAAAKHVAAHPGDRIVLRTPSQLMAMPAKQLEFPATGAQQAGAGYDRVGEVFRDPKTGKLILIEPATKP